MFIVFKRIMNFKMKGGRSIDLYSRKARIFRTAHAGASRLKRFILGILG